MRACVANLTVRIVAVKVVCNRVLHQINALPNQSCALYFTSAVPSIVGSLGANGFASRIELLWTPPTEINGIITGYFLTYSTGSGELSSKNIPASVTSYNVTGLEENTLYQLTVSAETSAGRGEGSSVSVRTLPDGG